MRLLYAEDEKALSEAIVDILEYHRYSVDAVYDGCTALEYAETGQYDGIILDIMMPGLDGLTVLQRLREKGIETPILLLTAKAETEDRIAGLDTGADDYLIKPFATGELLARIRAMLRRRTPLTPDTLTLGNLTLDCGSCTLSVGAQHCVLPRLEYQLLELLLVNRGIVLSTERILTKLWGYDSEAENGNVWVQISLLRKRLSALGASVRIVAKRGTGYTLEEYL